MVAKLQREQRSEAAVSAVLTSRCSSRLGASQKPLCLVNMHLCQHWECRYLPAFWLHDVSEHCVCWTTQLQNILWCFYNRNLWIVCLLESFVARQTNKTTNKIQRTRFTPTHLTIYLSTNLSIYPSIYHPSIRLGFSKHRFFMLLYSVYPILCFYFVDFYVFMSLCCNMTNSPSRETNKVTFTLTLKSKYFKQAWRISRKHKSS